MWPDVRRKLRRTALAPILQHVHGLCTMCNLRKDPRRVKKGSAMQVNPGLGRRHRPALR